jgi:uncharacterized protein
MTSYLLVVNVLIALTWPAHESHTKALNWFQRHSARGWATCPFTQAAFVRIVSNPTFSRDSVTPQEAISLLESNVRHSDPRFWPDEMEYTKPVQAFSRKLFGHRQVTNATFLGWRCTGKANWSRSIAAWRTYGRRNRWRRICWFCGESYAEL